MRPVRHVIVALSLIPLALPTGAAADGAARVSVKDYGVYETRTKRRVSHPNSATGAMNIISDLRFVRRARTIAAQMGRSFGWRYRLHGVPDNARITFRTIHPPITNPATGKTRTSSWRTVRVKMPGNVRYTGYTFDYTWELAEGKWAFQILYDGRVIGEQAFKVVVPLN